jgi:hypothetical protein
MILALSRSISTSFARGELCFSAIKPVALQASASGESVSAKAPVAATPQDAAKPKQDSWPILPSVSRQMATLALNLCPMLALNLVPISRVARDASFAAFADPSANPALGPNVGNLWPRGQLNCPGHSGDRHA